MRWYRTREMAPMLSGMMVYWAASPLSVLPGAVVKACTCSGRTSMPTKNGTVVLDFPGAVCSVLLVRLSTRFYRSRLPSPCSSPALEVRGRRA